jgi:phage protein U
MSKVFAHDKFVLVGAVPLFAVTNMTLDESFKIPEIGKGDKSQWLGKVDYSVTIQGVLVGPERFFYKAALEVMADLSMVLTSLVPIPGLGGIPLVSGLTVLPDMQITKLTFTQTSQEFGAVGVNISLKHCPKGFVAELIGRGLNVASSLAGSTANVAAGVRSIPGPFG